MDIMIETLNNKIDSELPETASLLVCIGPHLEMNKVLRTVKEMVSRSQSKWFAVYVEDPGMLRQSGKVRNQAVYNQRLAETLARKP
jgi:K+-sensing histidine kinase KdpD